MSPRKNPDGKSRPADAEAGPAAEESNGGPEAPMAVGEWTSRKRPVWRVFPGPRCPDVQLRIAMDRSSYADLIAHAKESVAAEVCGVMVGQVCEDDEGEFVDVQATIRATSVRQGRAHVTYTQETWSAIHETMEKKYPKLQIVGWYHSHPGYGVEFSDMDLFIQKNFFSGPAQFGLVTDPLGGDVAVCANISGKIEYMGRFWVDGREHRGRVPAPAENAGGSVTANPETQQRIASLEVRLNQALTSLDLLRATIHRTLFTLGLLLGAAIVVAIVYNIYSARELAARPPEMRGYAPIPVKIGDKTCLLGVGVVSWEVPPELLAVPAKPNEQPAADTNRSGAEAPTPTAFGSDPRGVAPSPAGTSAPAASPSPAAASTLPNGAAAGAK